MNRLIRFVKQLFNSKGNNSSKSSGNPWVGLASYDDPEDSAQNNHFYGRSKETEEVFGLIDNHLLITLYGKSGIGKTSLLNAGVFPQLRKENYFPIYIRLGITDDDTFAKSIRDSIEFSIIQKYGAEAIEEFDSISEIADQSADTYLWNYFARRRFHNSKGEIIFPVIVFDQFEEVLRNSIKQSIQLLNQLSFLVDKLNVTADLGNSDYHYDYNFRFVISIREDELYRLEDILNQQYLPALKQCRYRLETLSDVGAMEVVLKNGEGVIALNDREDVAHRIVEASKCNGEGQISTNLLSLICARLYDMMKLSGVHNITSALVSTYLKNNPFEEYYSNSISCLSERERKYIERNLITSDGRRNKVDESDIARNIKGYAALLEGSTRILRRVQGIAGEGDKIELIHDGLCEIVGNHQSRRLEKKNCTIYGLLLLIVGILDLIILRMEIGMDILLAIFKQKINFFAFCEGFAILYYPFVIGALVFNHQWQSKLCLGLLALFVLTLLSYFSSDYSPVSTELNNLWSNVNHNSPLLDGVSSSLIALLITILVTGTILFYGRKSLTMPFSRLSQSAETKIRRDYDRGLIGKIVSDGATTYYFIYLLAMAGFLWYLQFSSDSGYLFSGSSVAWAILGLPILFFLSLWKVPYVPISKIGFLGYYFFLIALVVIAINKIKLSLVLAVCLAGVGLVLLWLCYAQNTVWGRIRSVLVNFTVLCFVLFVQNGYNVRMISYKDANYTFPWKIVEISSQGYKGIQYALNGDTLLIPEFYRFRDTARTLKDTLVQKMDFVRELPSTPISDSLVYLATKMRTDGMGLTPFGLIPTPDSAEKLILVIPDNPNYDWYVASMANSSSEDISETDKVGAQLFFTLRNVIIRFCLSGNTAMMRNTLQPLSYYEKLLAKDLDNSLETLERNTSMMTEPMVASFLKSLSRCLYINMLKVEIADEKYSDCLENIRLFYNNVVLSSYKPYDLRINGTQKVNFKLNDTSQETERVVSTEVNDQLSGDAIKSGPLYAWDKLFNTLCMINKENYSRKYEKSFTDRKEDMESGFNLLLTKTLDTLLLIIRSNAFNPYRGTLTEICGNLYVVGAYRGYNMGAYDGVSFDSSSAKDYKLHKSATEYMKSRNSVTKSESGNQATIDSLVKEIQHRLQKGSSFSTNL